MNTRRDGDLDTDVQDLYLDIVPEGTYLQISEERMWYWAQRFADLHRDVREQRVREIRAVMQRIESEHDKVAVIAVAQLSALVDYLLAPEAGASQNREGTDATVVDVPTQTAASR